jgi:predicted TIM-barrel fold metal-dependent hydrolase
MADPGFRRGLTVLGDSGYSFDAWLYHPQLTQLAALARAVEGTTIVVDHLGVPLNVGPYQDRDMVRSVWREGLGQLAACPNVTLKLGGIGMDSYLFRTGWSSQPRPPTSDEVVAWWGDDIRWCIDTFGWP